MKVTYRIPTEQYAYVEIELQCTGEETAEQIRQGYELYVGAFKPKPENSLSDKEYNQFIDNMLMGTSIHVEVYQKMSPAQQESVQVIKKSLKRIDAKQGRV